MKFVTFLKASPNWSYFFPLLCGQVEAEKHIVLFRVNRTVRDQTFNIVTEVHVSVLQKCFC